MFRFHLLVKERMRILLISWVLPSPPPHSPPPLSHRLRKLDPEEEEDPFNNYEVQSEIKEENFQHVGPHRMSFDSTTFMESGKDFIITFTLSLLFLPYCMLYLLCFPIISRRYRSICYFKKYNFMA